ncbi:MAG: hypothetical protein ACRC3B_15800 [Bacteroidia bacterium]
MLKTTALLAALLCVAINSLAQKPLYDSLELAKRRIQKIVILSDYKDVDSSSVRVLDTLQVVQSANYQKYPLTEVLPAFLPQMTEDGSNVLVEKRNPATGKSDLTEITHYTSAQLIIAIVQRNLPTDSALKLPRNCPQHPSDSVVYRYDDQKRITEKSTYRNKKLISSEVYTYSRSGLPETVVVYDPKFLLSPEGTCVRKYVYLK